MEFKQDLDQLNFKELSKNYFNQHYIQLNKPLLIKGLLDLTPAKEWNLTSLEKELGHIAVNVFDSRKKNGTAYLFGNQTVQMNHMIDLIRENKASNLRMFVNPILTKNKKLLKELPCPSFFKCSFQLPNVMFIGGKGTIVPLHYDFMYDDGLLTQFFGRKEVILVDPSQSHLLYRTPFNSTSMVNLFDPNMEQFPNLKNIKVYRITLEHGDTLFIPSGYWHQMTYTDASLSIGFRKWHTNPIVTIKTAVLRLFQVPFDKSAAIILGKKWSDWKIKKSTC